MLWGLVMLRLLVTSLALMLICIAKGWWLSNLVRQVDGRWGELLFELINLGSSIHNAGWIHLLDVWYFTLHAALRWRTSWTHLILLLVLLGAINKAHAWCSVLLVRYWWIDTHVLASSVCMSHPCISFVGILGWEVCIGLVWIFVGDVSYTIDLGIHPGIYLSTLGIHHLYGHWLVVFRFSLCFICIWYVIISLQ